MVNEESTTTNFSIPDSTGKQHVTSVTTTKRGINRNENKNLHENKQNSKLLTDQSDYKSDSAAFDKTKEQETHNHASLQDNETKTPGWVSIAIVILVLGLIGLVYLVLKRFNVVK